MKRLLSHIKTGALLICCIVLFLKSYAQTDGKDFTVSLIEKIPLIIESGVYVDSLANQNTFLTLSGRIRIGLTPRKQKMVADQHFLAGTPLSVSAYPEVQYRLFFAGTPIPDWISLPTNENKPPKSNGAFVPVWLAEETIQDNKQLKLQFRFRGADTLIQENIFEKPMLVPEIKGYIFQNTFDSINSNLKSQAIRNTNKQPKGFTDLFTNLIKVPPGNSIEMLIRKKGLNLDSCIEYRLYNTKKQADTSWHKSGHLLALTKLHSNSNTILDLRYTGMSSYNRYYLQIAPFWYEKPWPKFILIFMVLFTVFLITYLTYKRRLRKEVNQRRQAEEQLRMVQSQLNPHFVFNALSTIEALVTNNENERANEYLTTFSDMMRDTLKNSRILFVSLSDDIAMLERYLTVEQLRFGFSFVMEIDPHLNIDLIEFPPMLLQPSLENAVKHGVSATGNAGIIILRYIKHKHDLVIQIVDNGKAPAKQHSKGTGMGIRFTKERVRNLQKLCKEDNMKYEISITGNGTIVDFHFQNWLAK